MSNRAVALVGAAFILAAGIWIDRLYNELELQKAQYETRIAALAQEVSEKEKARAEAVATAERDARAHARAPGGAGRDRARPLHGQP